MREKDINSKKACSLGTQTGYNNASTHPSHGTLACVHADDRAAHAAIHSPETIIE